RYAQKFIEEPRCASAYLRKARFAKRAEDGTCYPRRGQPPRAAHKSQDTCLEDKAMKKLRPVVGIIMGSDSDLPTMEEAARVCRDFGIPYEMKVVSAHRTPNFMAKYGSGAYKRGIKVIIAGAGGAAHLPGMTASHSPLPVIG